MAVFSRERVPLGIRFNEEISIMKGGRYGIKVKRKEMMHLFWIMFEVLDG